MRRSPRRRKNPLRRGSDRVQWWAARLLLVLALAGLPAALAAGLTAYHAQTAVARSQAATRHPVTARLAEDVPAGIRAVPAPVTWTTDGTAHRGTTEVDPGQGVGTPVRIWLDANGRLVHAPVPTGQATAAAWTAALVTATALPLVSGLAWKGTLHLLDRRRYARWDAEWQRVEPHWSRRQPS